MNSVDESEVTNALEVLKNVNDDYRYEKICEMSQSQKEKYTELLERFEQLNGVKEKDCETDNLKKQKGEALENLVKYLLEISGDIFEVERNIRTSTNEIDDLVALKQKGKMLLGHGLINKKLELFLGECKNYSGTVSVTYVGKFCSLMLTNSTKLGIMFSYHGISGKGWNNASGLVKKFYLHKEKLEERFCIIDFSIKEFKAILEGKNLLSIIDEQLHSLQFDTDYTAHISKHPAEDN